MSDTESKEVSTDEPAASTAQGVQNDTSSDFLTESEKEVLQDWLVYVTGLFAAAGVALGLNGLIQGQWAHNLISYSGNAAYGTMDASVRATVHYGNVWTIMMAGIVAATALGVLYGQYVDNTDQTEFKLGAATAIVGIPVLLVVATFLYTAQLDDWDPEFANLLVSGIGAGIAGAVGSAIAIWFTENKAPAALN